jgi:DNA-binding protein Fis
MEKELIESYKSIEKHSEIKPKHNQRDDVREILHNIVDDLDKENVREILHEVLSELYFKDHDIRK